MMPAYKALCEHTVLRCMLSPLQAGVAAFLCFLHRFPAYRTVLPYEFTASRGVQSVQRAKEGTYAEL
jgi:hypothetical protein